MPAFAGRTLPAPYLAYSFRVTDRPDTTAKHLAVRGDLLLDGPSASTELLHPGVVCYKEQAQGAHPVRGKGRAHPPEQTEGYEPSFSLTRADSRHAVKGDSYVSGVDPKSETAS
jgi:hypothetical protein